MSAPSGSAAAATTVNPATGEPLETYAHHTGEEVGALLERAVDAFGRHRETAFAGRAERMNRVADLLDERKRDLGALMTREMGKPIGEAVAEAEKCAWVCRYYAEHAEAQLADEPVETEARRSFIAYEPLGLVAAVMPWNFPLWQVFRFAAPNLMAGNVGVLKHAENVQGCARAIEGLFREGGFAAGAFQNLLVDHDRFAAVIADRRVRGVTLTGSGRAGAAVAAAAGRALKPTVLELGGSDPFIVLDDADLDRAVDVAVRARNQNNGQSCIAAKRFLLHRAIAGAFTERLVAAVEALTVGDPMDEGTDVGPMAREDLRDGLHGQVQRAVAEGAEVLTGGEPLDRPGFYYTPTVLGGVERGSVPFREELFGPVAALTVVEGVDEAVELANATPFGLGGAVFTEDRERGEQVARRLACGCAFVNEMVKSHPRLPFGGIKDSGYGRELSPLGIREFVNAKTVWVD
ncbi:MAG: NAD-dependent succinate-semialdehyde dehydrogenase [Rhodothermales bacterium]|nr:NAD-dependent succinate-semialdehyde dehydrogenase [Rhodothermales bacterium]